MPGHLADLERDPGTEDKQSQRGFKQYVSKSPLQLLSVQMSQRKVRVETQSAIRK